ncbi:GILT-like protein 2 [Scaptodrosophila lebanonensis]|uniref:GILT-like protein 2 n=1 Tax=Drosophila lebanonensis TaxID=7225 RepID=A0A6J2T7S1_DROLE|nr:GILT-like protein 2 [Scaptodrosophila lebanonensis]
MKAFFCVLLLGAFLLVLRPTGTSARHIRKTAPERLSITLYYETLCPDCMEFVTEQLYPSMRKHLPFTELTLVPYGNAQKMANGRIICQHGPKECELNAVHACILEHFDIKRALLLIECMMHNWTNLLPQCSSRYNLNVDDVNNCIRTRTVDEILKKYGEETVPHNGVPAIAVDNHYNITEQNLLSDHFDRVFCAKYFAKFNKKLPNC